MWQSGRGPLLQRLPNESGAIKRAIEPPVNPQKHLRQAGQKFLIDHGRGRFGPRHLQCMVVSNQPLTAPILARRPGMLRDVDLKGCYPAIMRTMNVYCGRPVLFEPGFVTGSHSTTVSVRCRRYRLKTGGTCG